MKKASKRANGDGTIYFDEKQKTWRAEIQWVDSAGVTHRKSWKDKKQASIKTKMRKRGRSWSYSGNNVVCFVSISTCHDF